jgi:hypothetical protein
MSYEGGGIIGINRNTEFFRIEHGRFEVTDCLWSAAKFRDLLQFEGPILSTVGFTTYLFCRDLHRYLVDNDLHFESMTRQLLERCVDDTRSQSLRFYKVLRDCGRNVFFTTCPQRCQRELKLYHFAFQKILIAKVQALGARFIDVHRETTDNGFLKPEYRPLDPEDLIHGNAAWARLVLDKFGQVSGLGPLAHDTRPLMSVSGLTTAWHRNAAELDYYADADGWYPAEVRAANEMPHRWSGPGSKSSLTLPLEFDAPCRISIEIIQMIEPSLWDSLSIKINGVTVPHSLVSDPTGGACLEMTCTPISQAPPRAQLVITLQVACTYRPLDLGINGDDRNLGFALRSISVSRVG